MSRLLDAGQVWCHPAIVVEIALGSIADRRMVPRLLDNLPAMPVASMAEVRRLIEVRALFSKGVGLVDLHLVASCLLAPGIRLWTRDRRLAGVAEDLGVGDRS